MAYRRDMADRPFSFLPLFLSLTRPSRVDSGPVHNYLSVFVSSNMLRTLLRPAAVRSALPKAPVVPVFSSFVRYNSNNFKVNTESHAYKYLQQGPKVVKFTAEHEWLAVHEDDTAFIGITSYAAEALGDATFVELPEVGQEVEAGESIGSVESVKSASEIYSPVAGEIVAINENLESNPLLINEYPMGDAWIAQIKLSEPSAIESDELLTEAQYESTLEQ